MSPQTKICPGCNNPFEARPNAKVCSSRCRKRLHRAKQSLQREVQKLAELRQAAIADIQSSLAPPQLATAAAEALPDLDSDTLPELPDELPEPVSFDHSLAEIETPTAVHPVGHIITPQPSIPPSTPPTPVAQPLMPQPTIQTLEAPLQPLVQPLTPLPEIQSLETKPTASHWQQLQNSWQAPAQIPNPPTPVSTEPVPVAPVPELSGTPPPPVDSGSSSGGPRTPFNFFSQRPILTGLGFVSLIVLISGVFALTGLLRQGQPGDTTNLAPRLATATYWLPKTPN